MVNRVCPAMQINLGDEKVISGNTPLSHIILLASPVSAVCQNNQLKIIFL